MASLDRASGIKIAEAIEKRIKLISKDLYTNAPYTTIRNGRITAINGKKYTIKINNAIYTNIYALKDVGTIGIGDVAICVIPNNQYSNMFILGVLDADWPTKTGQI